MNFSKRKIVLDFDDTLFKSSEKVIEILNHRYGLNKTIKDLKDWGYCSIYGKITQQEVLDIYASEKMFMGDSYSLLNEGVVDFLKYAKNKYQIVIYTKGSKQNLINKKKFCDKNKTLFGKDYEFLGIETFDEKEGYKLDKSLYDLSDCLFAVDDNIEALNSMNVPFKILIKNYQEQNWNKTPINSNVYVINNFNELLVMCQFDEQLRDKGEIIG